MNNVQTAKLTKEDFNAMVILAKVCSKPENMEMILKFLATGDKSLLKK